MRQTRYRYNPATCRYEPVPKGIKHVLIPVFLFLGVSTGLTAALLFLHSHWITSEKELALKHENTLLRNHHQVLSRELKTVNASLTTLAETEKHLQKKLIVGVAPSTQETGASTSSQLRLDQLLKKTSAKTNTLLQHTRNNNRYFGSSVALNAEDLSLLNTIPSLQPIAKQELTQLACGYGLRKNPYHQGNYFHRGIDLVAPRGTPVLASAPGKITDVRKSNLEMGEGNVIVIDHGNGFKTRYTHLGEINVKPGQSVTRGAVIATIGISGGSISPHLHYEVLKNNKHVDPIEYIMEGVTSNDYKILHYRANLKNQSLD